jgi:plasmid stability protein
MEAPLAQVLIRNIPDSVVETFKTKARLKGTSLEQYLRELIERNAPFTPDERAALSREYLSQFPEPVPSLTKDEIREGLL